MNERPSTYSELRKMIAVSRQCYVSAVFNNGADLMNFEGELLQVPVSKVYALSLYKGLEGTYYSDGGATAIYDIRSNTLSLS